MIVIIDGPDGGGKSTLVKQLSERLSLITMKDHKRTEAMKEYLHLAATMSDYVIWDRFHFGEYVYPWLKREEKRIPLHLWQLNQIECALMAKGAVLIYCDQPDETILTTYKERGETYIAHDLDEIGKMGDLYWKAYKNCLLPKFYYDYKQHTVEDIVAFIRQTSISEHGQNCIKGLFKMNESSGQSYKNGIMIIGDKYSGGLKFGSGQTMAFNGYVKGKASAFLHEALFEIRAKTSDGIYLTNAHKTGDREKDLHLLRHEVNELKPKSIITFGKLADDFVKKLNLERKMLLHPAYLTRFKREINPRKYANQIFLSLNQ